MKNTNEKIQSFMILLNNWGVTSNLSKNELQTLEIELKGIAGTAIMEANNAIQNILPDMYKQITK